jgi:prepilin-type N-terminal cleavage/methylation domain-containing protein
MKRRAGFTLVELMVAMAVTTVLIVMMVSLTSTVGNAWQRGDAQAETHASARGALTLLSRELQGAVVDLDLGFRVTTHLDKPNQFELRFLTRGEPTLDTVPAVKKVCYQLAWSQQKILARIQPEFSDEYPVPVLVRTESHDLSDVFVVSSANPRDQWTTNWGIIPETGVDPETEGVADRSEVAAENVLGWKVTPLYWDSVRSQTVPDRVDAEPTKYFNKYLTSDIAPRALEVEIMTMPTRQLSQGIAFRSQWADLRTYSWLFQVQRTIEDAGTDLIPRGPFSDVLRRHSVFFSATIYLQSKTP